MSYPLRFYCLLAACVGVHTVLFLDVRLFVCVFACICQVLWPYTRKNKINLS